MRIAVYRCMYGEDFVQESIRSIIHNVDKVFIFWTNKPWGNATGCIYKGKEVIFPDKFDNILEKINKLNNPKIELVEQTKDMNERSIPQNLYTTIINNFIIPKIGKPQLIIIPEVDHVFKYDQIDGAIKDFIDSGLTTAKTRQVELWRYPNYRIAERPNRIGVVFWNMKHINGLIRTGGNGEIESMPVVNKFVHNLGFAVSEKVMYWKHMTALGFSKTIHDSIPSEDWFDMWLNWDYITNNKDLEISKNYRHTISHAYPYNIDELPELIKHKFYEKHTPDLT